MMIQEVSREARLPSANGILTVKAFRDGEGKEHLAVIKGDVSGKKDVPVRIHSECVTGDVFKSLKCDCRQQLDKALEYVGEAGLGVVLYLRQEGRGIGLVNKINAYSLQDDGLDTVEANKELGFPEDMRGYSLAAEILGLLDVKSVRILTNNREKIDGLRQHGIEVSGRIPVKVEPNGYNISYLKTKKSKMKHMI
jgi:GTP cyclohydrolase II